MPRCELTALNQPVCACVRACVCRFVRVCFFVRAMRSPLSGGKQLGRTCCPTIRCTLRHNMLPMTKRPAVFSVLSLTLCVRLCEFVFYCVRRVHKHTHENAQVRENAINTYCAGQFVIAKRWIIALSVRGKTLFHNSHRFRLCCVSHL